MRVTKMSKYIETVEGFWGEKIHFQDGKKIGESWPGFFSGSYSHYDVDGKKVGHSDIGLFSDFDHYDADGAYKGYSKRSVLGGLNHYNDDGEYHGFSYEGMFSEKTDLE